MALAASLRGILARMDGGSHVRRTSPPTAPAAAIRRMDHATDRRDGRSAQVPNSGRRVASCDWSRWMIDECICETRDSLKSSVAPISFIVNSS